MTVKEAAKELGLKVRTVRQWIADGKLVAEKHGWYWFISEQEVYDKGVQRNAHKGRKHSRRVEEDTELGMLHGAGQDTEESAERKERKVE